MAFWDIFTNRRKTTVVPKNKLYQFEAVTNNDQFLQDITQFEQTTIGQSIGASKLHDLGRTKITLPIDGKIFDLGYTGGWVNSQGENLDSIYTAFENWVNQVNASNTKRSEYLKALTDQPGRQATILTDQSAAKTLLGTSPAKTLIG